ncbi:TonB-dependent receptor [Marinilabiliaceae bacterium JC017]|nr:TonB-dependent receptor [Marinilabiliaceae bacterium JC017]
MKRFLIGIFILQLLWGFSVVKADDKISPKDKGVIKGVVFDKGKKHPIEYATVAVYRAKDNSVVTGTVTDQNGAFKIAGLDEGDYYVVVSFLGYDPKQFDAISLKKGNRLFDVGDVVLRSASESLDEVEVVAERQSIDYRIDKKVVSVGKQMTAASLSAIEVLENVPSVRVDIEGNVSLRGSSGFTVLIDGKPSILEPSDALRQIPASTIENIEIITNPSVKYRPDGNAGIINVITKKNRLQGVQGLINANVGSYDRYGGDFLLNWQKEKVNFYIGADYNKRGFPSEMHRDRSTFRNDTISRLMSDGEYERRFNMAGIRAGLDLDLTDKDALSFGFRYGDRTMASESELDFKEWTEPGVGESEYKSFEESERGGDYYSLTGTYKHQFEEKGHELSAQLDFSKRNSDEWSLTELLDDNDRVTDGKRSTENGPSLRSEFRLDYTRPVGHGDKLETGFQGRLSNSEDENKLFTLNLNSGEYELEPEYSNNTEYTRNIYSVYGLYAGKRGNLGYQAGLRGEYTYREITTLKDDQTFTIDRWDLFPTIHLSYDLPGEHQLMTSYSRRIHRSRGYHLEPFVTWRDAYNVRQGNPDLSPEYIDSYELGYLKDFDKVQVSLETYYRVTHNKVERVKSVYQEGGAGDQNIILTTYENIGTDYSLGAEAMVSFRPFKWWNVDLTGNLYNYKVEGTLYDEPFSNTTLNWSTRVNNTIKVHKTMQFQLNGSYDSPTATAQGRTEGYYMVNAAVRADFMDRKMSAVLQVRDLFQTGSWESTSEGPDFREYGKFNRKSPFVTLTLSYRLNNFKPKRSFRSNGNGDMGEEDF